MKTIKEYLIEETATVDLRKKSAVKINETLFDARIIKKFILALPRECEIYFTPETKKLHFKWENGQAVINDLETSERIKAELEEKSKSPDANGKWGNA